MDTVSLQMIQTLIPLVWPPLVGGLFLQAIPGLMRPGLFFGATVDPRFRDSEFARGIRRRYSMAVWAGTLIVIALAVTVTVVPASAAWASTAPAVPVRRADLQRVLFVLQVAVALWAFVRANRATRPHAIRPASVVQVELSTRPEATSTLVAVTAVPIVSLAALGVWMSLRWPQVPSRMAAHWSFAGPDRWVSTTPEAVVMLLSRRGVVCLLLALLAWGVIHGSRRIATSGEAGQRERRFRMRIVSLLVAAEYFAAFPAWSALLSFPATVMTLWYLIWPMTILVLMARVALAGQGGLRGLMRTDGAPVGDRMEDRYWTGGLIYFNRADPAFLVERRFGVGYTFNFGHPFAWALLTLIAAVALIGRVAY